MCISAGIRPEAATQQLSNRCLANPPNPRLLYRVNCLVAAVCVAAFGGCQRPGGPGVKLTARAVETWTRAYPADKLQQIEIGNTNGTIDITAGEGASVEIVAERVGRGVNEKTA